MDDETAKRPTGLIVPRDVSLDAIIAPIRGALSEWRWIIDTQTGPFLSTWLFSDPKAEALVLRHLIDIPEFANTSTSAWNRGFVPKLHSHVMIDEWTYFYAMHCSEKDVVDRALAIAQVLSGRPAELMHRLADTDDLFLMHVDGWWEIYTTNLAFKRSFLEQFADTQVRSWRKFGNPPSYP